jgi:hypothetical protein
MHDAECANAGIGAALRKDEVTRLTEGGDADRHGVLEPGRDD